MEPTRISRRRLAQWAEGEIDKLFGKHWPWFGVRGSWGYLTDDPKEDFRHEVIDCDLPIGQQVSCSAKQIVPNITARKSNTEYNYVYDYIMPPVLNPSKLIIEDPVCASLQRISYIDA